MKNLVALATITLVVMLAGVFSAVYAAPTANDGEQFGATIPNIFGLVNNDDLFATMDLTTLVDPSTRATQHYGPYSSGSPDSGTCGPDWATDSFDRHFTVFTRNDGSFQVVEQFKKGSFVTTASPFGPSPGSCDTTDGSPPGTVDAGITGSMQGYFIIPIPSMTQSSTDPHCDAVAMSDAGCTTTIFINTHFPPCYPATCPVTTFFFHYTAGDQQLVEHEWKNASSDRGGNHGDIRSTNL